MGEPNDDERGGASRRVSDTGTLRDSTRVYPSPATERGPDPAGPPTPSILGRQTPLWPPVFRGRRRGRQRAAGVAARATAWGDLGSLPPNLEPTGARSEAADTEDPRGRSVRKDLRLLLIDAYVDVVVLAIELVPSAVGVGSVLLLSAVLEALSAPPDPSRRDLASYTAGQFDGALNAATLSVVHSLTSVVVCIFAIAATLTILRRAFLSLRVRT